MFNLPGLKLGRVIFGYLGHPGCFCLGQMGFTCFTKYPGLTWVLLWITCLDNRIWPWSKWWIELNLLDGDIGRLIFRLIDTIIRVFRWQRTVVHLKRPLSYHMLSTTFQWSFIGIALMQHEGYYTSCTVGVTSTLYVQEYLWIKVGSASIWLYV